VIPFIFIASESTRPLNDNSSLSILVSIRWDTVAGRFSAESISGRLRWPGIIPVTPPSIRYLKGRSSTASRFSFDFRITGRSTWESISVSPWPGKCFATEIIPLSCNPFIYISALPADLTGSSPNDLKFMTGFKGLLLRSATGARFMFTPALLNCPATAVPILYISESSWTAPRVSCQGNLSIPESLMPSPHSPSVTIIGGTFAIVRK